MTRAEMRRQSKEIEKRKATYTLNAEQIEQIKNDATKEACERAFILMLGLPLIVMRDRHDWGKKRLTDLAEGILDQYRCVVDGNVGLDEIMETITKETGMTFGLGKER